MMKFNPFTDNFDEDTSNPGDITGVTAGTGLTGGGTSGALSFALDTTYTDGRYVNSTGDTMSGNLTQQSGGSYILANSSNNSSIYMYNNGTTGVSELFISDFSGNLPITLEGSITMNGSNPNKISTLSDKNFCIMPHGIGNVGIATTSPGQKLTVIGNFELKDADTATKSFRFMATGSDLDFMASGKKMFFSNWSGANYTGTQRFYFALASSSTDVDAWGNWRYQSAPFGSNRVIILDAGTTPLEVIGTLRTDALRLDITPTSETITPTHTFTINLNGTDYKVPVVAA